MLVTSKSLPTPDGARTSSEYNGYSATVSTESHRSVNERVFHHRVHTYDSAQRSMGPPRTPHLLFSSHPFSRLEVYISTIHLLDPEMVTLSYVIFFSRPGPRN